jgi:hypothetical protein
LLVASGTAVLNDIDEAHGLGHQAPEAWQKGAAGVGPNRRGFLLAARGGCPLGTAPRLLEAEGRCRRCLARSSEPPARWLRSRGPKRSC